jgi:hypothetical protein
MIFHKREETSTTTNDFDVNFTRAYHRAQRHFAKQSADAAAFYGDLATQGLRHVWYAMFGGNVTIVSLKYTQNQPNGNQALTRHDDFTNQTGEFTSPGKMEFRQRQHTTYTN